MKTVLLTALFFVAACAQLPSGAGSSLVGEWRYADQIQSCHYSFKRDGSFTGEVAYQAKIVSRFSGRWSVRDDVLLYTYLSDVLGRIPVGATDRDKLLGVEKDSFLIEAADGSQRRYLRIR